MDLKKIAQATGGVMVTAKQDLTKWQPKLNAADKALIESGFIKNRDAYYLETKDASAAFRFDGIIVHCHVNVGSCYLSTIVKLSDLTTANLKPVAAYIKKVGSISVPSMLLVDD